MGNELVSRLSLLLLIFSSLSLSVSCNDGSVKPSSAGKAGEVLVVIDTALWYSEPGALIRDSVAPPMTGLPQNEPLFRLINVAEQDFKNILRLHRNILYITLDDTSDTENYHLSETQDIWAERQLVLKLSAVNIEWLEAAVMTFGKTIRDKFVQADRERMISGYSKLRSVAVETELRQKFGIRLPVTKEFYVGTSDENYSWIRRETEHVSVGIQIFRISYDTDGIFTTENIISIRDSVSRLRIPGPSQGTYMVTETNYPPVGRPISIAGNYAFMVKGLWKTRGDFMGGPFTAYLIHDKERSDLIFIDTFIFSPKFDKAEYVRQLDAIVHGLEL
jgi:hypothetical protein